MLVRQAERAGRRVTWPVEEIELASLDQQVLDALRPHLIERRVREYMVGTAIDDKDQVVVYCDPVDGRTLANGHHRVEAARRLARTTIKAELRQGNRQAALAYTDHDSARW
jgi:hypothetical protein